MKQDKINIIYTFDANYIFPTIISILSLYKNTKKIKIYCLVPHEDTFLISEMMKKYLNFIEIKIMSFELDCFNNMKVDFHFSKSMYLKLKVTDIIDADKAILIDSDTIITKNIEELFNEDLKNNLIGAIEDIEGTKTTKIKRDKNDKYINSGVMLLNLKLIRNENFFQKALEVYNIHKDEIIWPDQDIINKITENKKLIFSNKFNKQIFSNKTSEEEFKKILKNDNYILHFVGPVKPWQKWCNPSIFNFYNSFVKENKIYDFQPIEIQNVDQAISLANYYEINNEFELACKIKNNIIRILLQHIKAS